MFGKSVRTVRSRSSYGRLGDKEKGRVPVSLKAEGYVTTGLAWLVVWGPQLSKAPTLTTVHAAPSNQSLTVAEPGGNTVWTRLASDPVDIPKAKSGTYLERHLT